MCLGTSHTRSSEPVGFACKTFVGVLRLIESSVKIVWWWWWVGGGVVDKIAHADSRVVGGKAPLTRG